MRPLWLESICPALHAQSPLARSKVGSFECLWLSSKTYRYRSPSWSGYRASFCQRIILKRFPIFQCLLSRKHISMEASLQFFTHSCLVPFRTCLRSMRFDACVQSCFVKNSRWMQFPYYYFSNAIHLLNKICTAAKGNYKLEHLLKLREVANLSIQLAKTLLIDSLCTHSTRSCFKNLRSFSSNQTKPKYWQNLSENSSKAIPISFISIPSFPTVVTGFNCLQKL